MKNILKYIIYAIAIIAVSAVIIHITERDSYVDEVKKTPNKIAEEYLPWCCCEYCNDYKNCNDAALTLLALRYDAEHHWDDVGEWNELYGQIIAQIIIPDEAELFSTFIDPDNKSYITIIQEKADKVLSMLGETYLSDDPIRLFVYYLNFPKGAEVTNIKLDFSNSHLSDMISGDRAQASDQLRTKIYNYLHKEASAVSDNIMTRLPRQADLIDYAYMASEVYSCEELPEESDAATKVYEVVYKLKTTYLKNSESGYWAALGLKQPEFEYVLCTLTVYKNGRSKLSLEDHSYKLSDLI